MREAPLNTSTTILTPYQIQYTKQNYTLKATWCSLFHHHVAAGNSTPIFFVFLQTFWMDLNPITWRYFATTKKQTPIWKSPEAVFLLTVNVYLYISTYITVQYTTVQYSTLQCCTEPYCNYLQHGWFVPQFRISGSFAFQGFRFLGFRVSGFLGLSSSQVSKTNLPNYVFPSGFANIYKVLSPLLSPAPKLNLSQVLAMQLRYRTQQYIAMPCTVVL